MQRQQQHKKEVPAALLIAGLQELIDEGEDADRRRQTRLGTGGEECHEVAGGVGVLIALNFMKVLRIECLTSPLLKIQCRGHKKLDWVAESWA